MSEPFIGEVKIVSFNFPPKGWAFCNGQLLPINQNQALFSILGTTYGGDGRVTFALPNLQGRVPIHVGNGISLGEALGEENHTLILSELPQHNHPVVAVPADAPTLLAGRKADNTKNFAEAHAVLGVGSTAPVSIYGTGSVNQTFHPGAVTNVGGSQAHTNQQPFLVVSMIIALQGIFPSQN